VYGAVPLSEFAAQNTFEAWTTWYDTSNDDRIDWEEYYAGITDVSEFTRINND